MEKRRQELLNLNTFTERIDNELTLILQCLQWDRNHLLQKPPLLSCKYDSNHKMPPNKREEHEKECFLRLHGYSKEDQLLPEPLDTNSKTLVKLRKEDINKIIEDASYNDPNFKREISCMDKLYPFSNGVGSAGPEPMSLERLQSTYTSEERRAIHEAVVSAAPSCHDLADLALTSTSEDTGTKMKILSRAEILAELRNMRRRRTKYRVAAKTRNYSDVLRDVIKTQMEHYNEPQNDNTEPSQDQLNKNKQTDNHDNNKYSNVSYKGNDRYEDHRKNKHRDDNRHKRDEFDRHRENKQRSDRDKEKTFRERYDRNIEKERPRDSRHEERVVRYSDQTRDKRHEHDKDFRGRDVKAEKQDQEYRDNSTTTKDSRHTDEYYREYSRKRKHSSNRDKTYDHVRIKQELVSGDEDRGTTHGNRNDDVRHSKHKRSKESRKEKDRHKEKERGYSRHKRKDQESSSSSYYDNIVVKTERVSRERSYDSYSTEASTRFAEDKHRRYYDTHEDYRGRNKERMERKQEKIKNLQMYFICFNYNHRHSYKLYNLGC